MWAVGCDLAPACGLGGTEAAVAEASYCDGCVVHSDGAFVGVEAAS